VDQLWAPWRLAYIANPAPPKPDECFICTGLRSDKDRENLIALRTSGSVVLLNRFPYNNGHLLVAPQAHKGELQQLEAAEMQDLMNTVTQMVSVVKGLINPDGFNIGLNQGRVAGAGLPGHVHWHIVPRWNGDTNFMPVISDTKVISQSLDAFWEMLTQRIARNGT
jgi:ATP adenylyltransferase